MFSFVETQLFTKLVVEYMSDDDYAALQPTLMADPEAGPVIPGSGGVRELRWGAGPRKAGRIPCHLPREAGGRRDLALDHVSEERGREHSGQRAQED